MIKRIKYGCFALLFISTLTLSSIVAILASSKSSLDNSFLLTYEPPREVSLLSGQEFSKVLKNKTYFYESNSTITSITFGKNDAGNLALVEGASRCVSVAEDGSDDILLYEVGTNIYILSSAIMCANADSSYMFLELKSLTNLVLDELNTSYVTNMYGMFEGCTKLTNVDFSTFNTSNVTNMCQMFYKCSSLKNLDLTSFNTAKVTNMKTMFSSCSSLASLDLSSFDTINVTDMGTMFFECVMLTTIYGTNWNTSSVTSSGGMFSDCTSLVGGNGTNYNSSYTDATYARIDTAETSGYFTRKTA